MLKRSKRRKSARYGRILHVVPFEVSRMRPIVDTVQVCRDAGISSLLVTTTTPFEPAELEGAEIVAPASPLSMLQQQGFLWTQALRQGLRFQPDLVIGHRAHGVGAAAAVATALGCPLVYHCVDPNRDRPLTRVVEHAAAARAKELWFPSLERAQLGGFEHRALVVRNCLRRQVELPARGSLRPWLLARGSRVAPDSKIILRHGRIGPPHCVLETIEALAALPALTELVVLGDGDEEYMRACKERARSLGLGQRVHLHPFAARTELLPLIVDGDISMCAYSHRYHDRKFGAGPMKLYESLAVGMPAIVDEGCSFASEIVEAGVGLAIPTDQPDKLVRALVPALLRLLEQRAVMGKIARTAHLTRFNFEAELDQTLLGPHLREDEYAA